MPRETRARIAIGLWIVLAAFVVTIVAYFVITVRGVTAAMSGLNPARLEHSLPLATERLGSTFGSAWLVHGVGAFVATTAAAYVGLVWTSWWVKRGAP